MGSNGGVRSERILLLIHHAVVVFLLQGSMPIRKLSPLKESAFDEQEEDNDVDDESEEDSDEDVPPREGSVVVSQNMRVIHLCFDRSGGLSTDSDVGLL